MSPELHIRRDLLAGRTTADSIAGRLAMHNDAVLVILRREELAGNVISYPLSVLTVWTLTHQGKQDPKLPTP